MGVQGRGNSRTQQFKDMAVEGEVRSRTRQETAVQAHGNSRTQVNMGSNLNDEMPLK